MKKTLLKRKMGLKRGKGVKRKTPLRRVSKRGRQQNLILLKSKEAVRERSGGRCEVMVIHEGPFAGMPAGFLMAHEFTTIGMNVLRRCDREADSHHHVVPRSKGRDDSHQNLFFICFQHHNWIHNNPASAREMGLLK